MLWELHAEGMVGHFGRGKTITMVEIVSIGLA